ncbi:MAG: 50S ribosomal protein L10 [Candidatus Zixiibacteriota bacterium]|nr:MAG: 50S ribosomal protein L10 [candidate division Zixibacteria bacterium]
MNREQKEKEVAVLKDMLSRSRHVTITDHTGINVGDLTQLRRNLKEASSEFRVSKNTFFRHAVKNTDFESLAEFFTGPTSVVFGYDDPVKAAKVINQSIKDIEKPKFKGYYYEGQILGFDALKRIAELPSQDRVIAILIATVEGPISSFIGVLDGAAVEFIATLDALAESRR